MTGMKPEDIYNIAWMGDCAISPNGATVLYTLTRLDREDDDYRSAIWRVSSDGGSPMQFTAGAKRDSMPRWSPDGSQVAFASIRGEEKAQLYVMPASGGESRGLTDAPFGVGEPVWSPDGRSIAYVAQTGDLPDEDEKKAKPYRRIASMKYRINGEGFIYDRRRHIFVIGLEGGDGEQITDGDWDDGVPAWTPDSKTIVFASARHEGRDTDIHTDLWKIPASGGRPQRLTETSGGCSAPSVSPDGQTIAHVHTPQWPANGTLRAVSIDATGIATIDPSFDRTTGVGSAPGPVARPAWLPDGSLLSAAADRGRQALITAKPGEQTGWVTEGDQVISWYSVSADGARVAVVSSSVSEPSELSVIDLANGDEVRITRHNEAWIQDTAMTMAERLVVPTAEGVEVDCWIMKPAGLTEGRSYPVLLNVHGGPFGQYGETFFDEFQVLTAAGYGVVFCNPRGSAGQSTQFSRAVVGDMGGVDFHDVMTSFDAALAQMPWADQSRLGIIGGSYGGFMTSWAVGHTNRFAAACSERAVNDWYSMQGQSDIGSYFNPEYLGEAAKIQEDLDAVLGQSPLTYAKDIETPLLILHSENDLRCPIAQAEHLFVVLKQMGKDVEFVRFPDEDHELSRSGRPSHRVDRFDVILDYFDRKLG